MKNIQEREQELDRKHSMNLAASLTQATLSTCKDFYTTDETLAKFKVLFNLIEEFKRGIV